MISVPSTPPAPSQPDPSPGPAAADGLPAGVTAVLDAAALARLRELDPGGKAALVERVLRTFASSLGKLSIQLAQARLDGDNEGVRHVAHTLRSSSASVGAIELSRICAEIERHLREGRPGGLGPLLDDMVDESTRVARALAHLPAP